MSIFLCSAAAGAADRTNPYACEGVAQDLGSRLSVAELKTEADSRATLAAMLRTTEPARAAVLFCQEAELYKRLGSPKTAVLYANAVSSAPDEPALELFFSKYLM